MRMKKMERRKLESNPVWGFAINPFNFLVKVQMGFENV